MPKAKRKEETPLCERKSVKVKSSYSNKWLLSTYGIAFVLSGGGGCLGGLNRWTGDSWDRPTDPPVSTTVNCEDTMAEEQHQLEQQQRQEKRWTKTSERFLEE